ncbi:MAG: tetratricopeptide repeat protein [Prevotella sp.]|nr:tetratricopeptide repeat protein [Prevotella sp.]
MDIATLIKHPENLNKETLYDLRSLLALYPYYQPARILLLQNLFLLHDPTFDEELRRAAIYITDRRILFNLVEEAHYQLAPQQKPAEPASLSAVSSGETAQVTEDRTTSLIDNFLEQIPEEETHTTETAHRKPTPADATVDYVAYLLETENEQQQDTTPQLKGQELIDDFINKDGGKITLQEETEYEPEENDSSEEAENEDTGYFTETLARIYIKQGRYSKALEIIKRLNLVYPKKNRYFADQIRFLEKLIINNNKK